MYDALHAKSRAIVVRKAIGLGERVVHRGMLIKGELRLTWARRRNGAVHCGQYVRRAALIGATASLAVYSAKEFD